MTKTVKPLAGKKLDAVIEQAYTRNCSGIQIPMLEIPKIYKVARDAYAANLMAMGPQASEAAMVATMVSYVNAIKIGPTIGEPMTRDEVIEQGKIDEGYEQDRIAAINMFCKTLG